MFVKTEFDCTSKYFWFSSIGSWNWPIFAWNITIHYGTQLMPSVVFLPKNWWHGHVCLQKMNFLLFYELQQLTFSYMSPFVNNRRHVPVCVSGYIEERNFPSFLQISMFTFIFQLPNFTSTSTWLPTRSIRCITRAGRWLSTAGPECHDRPPSVSPTSWSTTGWQLTLPFSTSERDDRSFIQTQGKIPIVVIVVAAAVGVIV